MTRVLATPGAVAVAVVDQVVAVVVEYQIVLERQMVLVADLPVPTPAQALEAQLQNQRLNRLPLQRGNPPAVGKLCAYD